jgi:hypothetical protein
MQKALNECYMALPTDGLGITNSDFDQLLPNWRALMGHNFELAGARCYEKIDDILKRWMEGNNRYEELKDHELIKRLQNTEHKRRNPYNIPREKIIP